MWGLCIFYLRQYTVDSAIRVNTSPVQQWKTQLAFDTNNSKLYILSFYYLKHIYVIEIIAI